MNRLKEKTLEPFEPSTPGGCQEGEGFGLSGFRSRNEMIERNMGLVHSCAHRFQGKGIEYEDLFQAGCMGLIKAVDAFDWERGVRFSTYAVPVILGEMRRLFRDGGTVKVSRTLRFDPLTAGNLGTPSPAHGGISPPAAGAAGNPPSMSWRS